MLSWSTMVSVIGTSSNQLTGSSHCSTSSSCCPLFHRSPSRPYKKNDVPVVDESQYNIERMWIRGGHSESQTSSSSLSSPPLPPLPSQTTSSAYEYITLASPAPGTPFHWAIPVHDLNEAKQFYANVLGCQEGRSSTKWQDYSLFGHQIVCHWVGNNYRCMDYFNPVDGDEVPVPHSGLVLSVDQFHHLAHRVREAGIPFIIEPHLRFQGGM
jgi:uncharacterized protein